jgi:hypothetical protein
VTVGENEGMIKATVGGEWSVLDSKVTFAGSYLYYGTATNLVLEAFDRTNRDNEEGIWRCREICSWVSVQSKIGPSQIEWSKSSERRSGDAQGISEREGIGPGRGAGSRAPRKITGIEKGRFGTRRGWKKGVIAE